MLPNDIIDKIVNSEYHDPFQILGVHFSGNGMAVIRTFQPHARSVDVLIGIETKRMNRIHNEGMFEIEINRLSCPDPDFHPFSYRFQITYFDGNIHISNDPYRFLPQLGDVDKYLFNSGTHYSLYNHMGAHVISCDNIQGTIFRVWAPAAKRVSVLGNFNSWEAILLAVALILFILSSLFGLTTNRPRNYGVLSLEIPAQPERQGPASAQRAHNGGVSQRDD